MSQAFCAKCSAALGEGSAFCSTCGAPVPAAAAAEPPPGNAADDQAAAAVPPVAAPAAMATPPSPDATQPSPAPGGPPPAKATSGWGWQRWLLLVVGVIGVLAGLRQIGILPGGRSAIADDPRSRAMIGRWAGDSSCRGAMTFNADGSYEVLTGAVARWRMDGDRLVLSGDGAGREMRLVAWTQDSLTFLMGETGLRYTMVRCGGSAGPAAPASSSAATSAATGTGAAAAPSSGLGLQGLWGVEFDVDGTKYSGEFVGANGSGTLTLSYMAASGPMRVREQCAFSGTATVTVSCRDPEILSGRDTYSPDTFTLTQDGAGAMGGTMSSTNGDNSAVTFTRR